MAILDDITRALLNPRIYPESTTQIEIVQTQMSLVFITDNFVYKIKQPVDLGYLDYTKLSQRKFFCEQEVKLNSRFGGDIYLGVIPLFSDGQHITFDSIGCVIEYAVKMRRLPAEMMMDALLAKKQVTNEMIHRVAAKVADFHNKAETSPVIGKYGNIETITFNIEENFSQTEKYLGQVFSKTQFSRLRLYARDFIKDNVPLFQKRLATGKIKDCHGDLHCQHICFTGDGISIYDCIEFNDRFRYVDVAAEVSFLAMDLDRWGFADLSKEFVNHYITRSNDKDILKLLNFYKCYFAYVRAKVNCFRLGVSSVSEEANTRVQKDAQSYFNLAESYIE